MARVNLSLIQQADALRRLSGVSHELGACAETCSQKFLEELLAEFFALSGLLLAAGLLNEDRLSTLCGVASQITAESFFGPKPSDDDDDPNLLH